MLKKIFKFVLVLAIAVLVIQIIWYQIDGIPTPEADTYMSGAGFAVTENEDGSYWFRPDTNNGQGIVIMHGALILPKSYAKSAAYFAAAGYTVYLPHGTVRLSITAVDNVAETIKQSGISDWFFIGHSMGGMASLETISRYSIPARGVALWATSMPSDYSQLTQPILFIWGDTDGLLPRSRLESGKTNLPAHTQYITLNGANHKNFSLYSHQFFDSEATIGWDTQIDFANQTTHEFFNSLSID